VTAGPPCPAGTLGILPAFCAAGSGLWLEPRQTVAVTAAAKYWAPFARTSIHHINRGTVALRMSEIASKSGPIAANRSRSTLSAMFGWAMREGIVDANPVVGTNKAAEEASRERVLSSWELADIWAACREDGYGRMVRLLMLTGQRHQEDGGMRWGEIDLDRGMWSLPGERAKNKRPHAVPLAPIAVSMLESSPRRAGRDYVFGEGKAGFSGWARCKEALDRRIREARAKVAAVAGERAGLPQPIAAWRMHDLRRTVATGMAELGVQPHIVEAVLNHRSGHKGGVAGVYNRATYGREVGAALALWADHLRSIVEHGERKIVPLKKPA
jgi:integrase